MNKRNLINGEIVMKLTQLIGLEETERKIYECLENHKAINGDLLDAYRHHQEGLESLIKYQKSLSDNSTQK